MPCSFPLHGVFDGHLSPLPLLQNQTVGDHGYELAVRRLAFEVGNGVAEKALEGLDVAAIPCDLDGVADYVEWSEGSHS